MSADTNGWMPIDTAPELDRIIVAGWSNRSGRTAGYWWFDEDIIIDGKAVDHPDALLWHPYPKRPSEPPVGGRA